MLGRGGGERGEVGWERMRARHGDTQAMVRYDTHTTSLTNTETPQDSPPDVSMCV